MRVNELLIHATNKIGNASSSARLDSELLLGHLLKLERVRLVAALQDQVPDQIVGDFLELLQRRIEGTPIAYLIGEREFYGRRFIVTPDVLIPRPETELLIARMRSLRISDHSRVLDIGTGSGCIGVTAACEFGCQLVCVDISPAALEIARKNAALYQVESQIEFVVSDVFEGVEPQLFDLIVANPPYLSPQEFQDRPALSFEPRCAFVSNDDGLAMVRTIFELAPQWLRPSGTLLCEFGYRHEQMLEQILSQLVSQHGGNTQILKDLAGIGRVAEWRRGLC